MEGLNRAVESMFLAALPGYARQPRPGKRAARPKDEVLLSFEDFTARLLTWTLWWKTEHRSAAMIQLAAINLMTRRLTHEAHQLARQLNEMKQTTENQTLAQGLVAVTMPFSRFCTLVKPASLSACAQR